MTDDVRLAWAYLSRVAEPPCAELTAFAVRVGAVEAADVIRRGGAKDELARRTDARREMDSAAADLDVLDRMGGRLITPTNPEWPMFAFAPFGGVDKSERPQAHPPMVLWAVGPERLNDVP